MTKINGTFVINLSLFNKKIDKKIKQWRKEDDNLYGKLAKKNNGTYERIKDV